MIEKLRSHFKSGATLSIEYRIEQLKRFKRAIENNIEDIYIAINKDLGKSKEESHLTEVSMVLNEIDYHIKNIKKWSRSKSITTPIALFPSKSKITYQPYGVVLIIAPWNYPFQLLFNPMVAAIAAGNCIFLKPSHLSSNTSQISQKIVKEAFDESFVDISIEGTEVMMPLLEERFDYIFYTGGPNFGRVVMQKAASFLTPVTLELGGKSPCIIDKSANISVAAKRVAWGKCLNAGQTCIAPDYLFLHNDIADLFIEEYKKTIKQFFGEEIKSSPQYGRIINEVNVDRIEKLMHSSGTVIFGGEIDRATKYISPTLIDGVEADSPIMQEEIFGPLLPIMRFNSIEEVTNFVSEREKPLALYYFGDKRSAKYLLKRTSSGGAVINDTIIHLANKYLPFGGVGESGMGSYHGKMGFLTFSHARSVLVSNRTIDFAIKYPPYTYFNILKKFF